MSYNIELFVDCGAPSLYNALSRKVKVRGQMGTTFKKRKLDDYSYVNSKEYKDYRKSYIDFITDNKTDINVYSNLDVINNAFLTYRNQKILEEAGLNPIPVWHLNSDIKYLKRYLDQYDYIAIGGLVPNPTRVLLPMLDDLFKNYIIQENGFPRVKLHGFACTSMKLMLTYPWYSVDSASCRKLAAYGKIVQPQLGNNERLSILTISTRDLEGIKQTELGFDVETKNPMEYRISAGNVKSIKFFCDKYSIPFEELVKDCGFRTVWNYMMYLNILQNNLPGYPWKWDRSKKHRIALKEASEMLHFYFAGSMTKREENLLWATFSRLNRYKEKGRRLTSFFYKGETTYLVNNK